MDLDVHGCCLRWPTQCQNKPIGQILSPSPLTKLALSPHLWSGEACLERAGDLHPMLIHHLLPCSLILYLFVFALGVKYLCTPWPRTCFNNTIVSKILNLKEKLKLEKSWVVIVQMTLGGPGCRLQTCRRREAQWFDSTFWAVQAPHFFAPDQPCPGFQVLFFQVPGFKI